MFILHSPRSSLVFAGWCMIQILCNIITKLYMLTLSQWSPHLETKTTHALLRMLHWPGGLGGSSCSADLPSTTRMKHQNGDYQLNAILKNDYKVVLARRTPGGNRTELGWGDQDDAYIKPICIRCPSVPHTSLLVGKVSIYRKDDVAPPSHYNARDSRSFGSNIERSWHSSNNL